MESIDTSLRLQTLGNSIDDLPDEVLEFVLGFLPPYKDLQDCMCVCKRWYICAQNVMRKTSNKLIKAIAEFKIQWRNITPVDMAPTITKRFSHAACVHENSMYIFGGCTTNSTAFNDLWRFDLSKRQWIRPLAMGTYPAPKAYASMICYKDCLILFGGWTYPSPSQYYQDWTMFSEIHFYNITSNRWILINASNNPPPMAGHSATIHNDQMIVFGGLYKPLLNPLLVRCSNDVWVLDIGRMTWHKQATSEARPAPRYGQSLISLDNNNLMILGGVQAPHNRFVYNDCWILTMEGPVWTWREITVKNKEWSAANIWCNPACKVGDKVVSLSRNQNGVKQIVTSAVRLTSRNRPDNTSVLRRVEQCARKPLDKDLNINGRRGALPHRRTNSAEGSVKADSALNETTDDPMPGPSTSGLSLGKQIANSPSLDSMNERRMQVNSETAKRQIENNNPVIPPKSFSNKDVPVRRKTSPLNKPNGMKIVRQLHEADKFRMAAFACDASIHNAPPENDLVNQRQIGHLDQRPQPEGMLPDNGAAPQPAVKKLRRNTLTMHVLDISTVLNGNSLTSVSWLCPTQGEVSGAPEELVMYSLVRGKGELIMFGGVHNDINLLSNYSSSHQYQYSNSLHFIIPPRDII